MTISTPFANGFRWLAVAFCAAGLVTGASAQDYPSRNVTIVVPLAAGTGMDAVVRSYAEELSKALGKPVVVENQPGASLTLAANSVARATPDGHTLVVLPTLQVSAPHAVVKTPNYDPERDFVPISVYLSAPFVLVVTNGLGVDTVKGLVALAKSRAGNPLTYATSGTGSFPHLAMEALKIDLGFMATHVPYRNSGQIISDVIGGHVPAAMSETGAALGLLQDGRLKALAITSTMRHPQLPGVPTMAEAADKPGYEAVSWHALLAPSATPHAIVARLATEMRRITGTAAFQDQVATAGLIARAPMSPDEIDAFIKSERVRWAGFAKSLAIEAPQ